MKGQSKRKANRRILVRKRGRRKRKEKETREKKKREYKNCLKVRKENR